MRNIVDLIDEHALDLAPDFQRLRVWKPVQKAQLIESILLQIPLPAFYFAEDVDGVLRVVDGVQRLSTIHDFVRGGPGRDAHFALNGVEYVQDVRGKHFADLPPLWQAPPAQHADHRPRHRPHDTPSGDVRHLPADQHRRYAAERAGDPALHEQQAQPRLLRALTQLPEFHTATSGLLRNQRRMIDREVALRFVAFMVRTPVEYANSTMERFLWEPPRACSTQRNSLKASSNNFTLRLVDMKRCPVEVDDGQR